MNWRWLTSCSSGQVLINSTDRYSTCCLCTTAEYIIIHSVMDGFRRLFIVFFKIGKFCNSRSQILSSKASLPVLAPLQNWCIQITALFLTVPVLMPCACTDLPVPCESALWKQNPTSVLITIITWPFKFHPMNVSILHLKGKYNARSQSCFTCYSHCCIMWCFLMTGIKLPHNAHHQGTCVYMSWDLICMGLDYVMACCLMTPNQITKLKCFRFVLQLPLPNPLKPSVKWRMKM